MLSKKINAHCKVIKSIQRQDKKIQSISNKIKSKILNGGKLLFVVMVVRQLTHSIWQQSS